MAQEVLHDVFWAPFNLLPIADAYYNFQFFDSQTPVLEQSYNLVEKSGSFSIAALICPGVRFFSQ